MSSDSSIANSSACSSISSEIRQISRPRSDAFIRRHGESSANALRAALHRPVDVLGLPVGDLGEDLLGGRVERLERLARRRLDPLAVDQQLVR